jgi:hypothetical protein
MANIDCHIGRRRPNKIRAMVLRVTSFLSRLLGVALCAVVLVYQVPLASAQSGDTKASEKPQPKAGEPTKDQKKPDEFEEAAKTITGPAGNAECVWLGRRVVNLLWRDDLDTAFRHLDLYDRFGCPGGHVQMTFRCVVRQGNIDPKVPETLDGRVRACWVNPAIPAATATAATPSGTTQQ